MVVVAVGIASQLPFIFFVFIGRFVSQRGEGVGLVQCDAHHGAGTVQEQARIQSFLQVFLQIVHLGVTPFQQESSPFRFAPSGEWFGVSQAAGREPESPGSLFDEA